MKLLFFDLETTGVRFWKNGIHQISGKIVIDGETKERFDFKVKPFKDALIEQQALDVAGVTIEQINNYQPMSLVYDMIITMLSKYVDKYNKKDKFHLVGYNNASFDNQFLRAFFTQMNDHYFGSWFWSDSIDVMVLASNYLKNERTQMENFKLSTVAKYLNIDVKEDSLHDAQYDIDLTEEIYNIVS